MAENQKQLLGIGAGTREGRAAVMSRSTPMPNLNYGGVNITASDVLVASIVKNKISREEDPFRIWADETMPELHKLQALYALLESSGKKLFLPDFSDAFVESFARGIMAILDDVVDALGQFDKAMEKASEVVAQAVAQKEPDTDRKAT